MQKNRCMLVCALVEGVWHVCVPVFVCLSVLKVRALNMFDGGELRAHPENSRTCVGFVVRV